MQSSGPGAAASGSLLECGAQFEALRSAEWAVFEG